MKSSKLFRKVSFIFLAMMIVFSNLPLQANIVHAEDLASKETSISENLTKAFETEDQVTYIVRMKEQQDVQQAKKEGELAATFSMDVHMKQADIVRSHVVHSLQETSNETQMSLTSFLDKKKKDDSVQSYHSFYIINGVEVTSNEEVMKEIAKREDVLSLALNESHLLGSKDIEKPRMDTKNTESKEAPWNLTNMNVPEAWDLGIDGEGVTVGIIDSGVDYEHPALKSQWRGSETDEDARDAKYHWIDTTRENTKLPSDKNGHGTHVAGSVLGQESDGSNKIGVAPQSNWIAAKVFNEEGETSDSELLKAGEWMLAPGGRADLAPDIINNSWSISAAGKNEYFREVVQAWRAVNILPVFAAGNTRPGVNDGGPGSVPAPANYPEAFTVGALNEDNKLASFSLQGPSPYEKTKPEISAPGESIRSAAAGGGYAYMDGTSMASPHIVGLAALVLQANPSLTVDELEEVLMDTANPLTDKEFPSTPNNGYGYGIGNALNAVSLYTGGLGELTGEVTIEGEDDEAPEIFHTSLNLTFNVLDQEIYAQVKDNTGITSVQLETRAQDAKDWDIHEMKIVTGDTKNGEYEGIIPAGELTLPGIEYRIQAVDYSGNETVTETYALEVSEGVKKGYTQDFETDIDGFDFQGDDIWEWGTPTTGPESAHSGDKVMATKLDGNYENGSEGMLILPMIDLRDETESTVLSYSHWYKLGNWMMAEHDTAEVYVGTKSETEDAFNFELMKLYDYSQREWKKDHVDLTPYLGEQIIVIFNLRGNHGTDLGWYVDDIELSAPEAFIPDTPDVSVRSNAPGRVIVEWSYIDNDAVKDYVVYRSNHPTEGFEELASTEGRVYGDKPTEQKGTYYYYVRSRTYGNELSESSETVSWTFTGGEEIYSTDFEGDSNDWIAEEGSDWELGMPSSNPGSVVSGENAWGTNLNGNYKSGQDHVLTSPSIDLTESEHASIYFQQWYAIDNIIGEYGLVEITKDDGETWNKLESYPKDHYDTNHPSRFWYLDEINIDDYVGEHIQVRFRLNSKSENVFDAGWYIDDFEVRDTPAVKTQITSSDEQEEKVEEEQVESEEDSKTEETELSVEAPSWDEIIETRKHKQVVGESVVQTTLNESKLPIGADISILETNRETSSDAGTGEYSIKHPDGEYTVQVSAYGYQTVKDKVEIQKDELTTQNFDLEPLAKGNVSGTLTDELTGKPIVDATIKVMEDTKVTPAKTDKNGKYTLEVYEGNYHLVASAVGYLSTEVQITVDEKNITENMKVTPYEHGEDITLIYDDGTAENAVASRGSDMGYAVKMTSEEQAQVLNARFYFWDEGWPTPGGEDFQYAIYDADGKDGSPGTLLAGPYDAQAILDGSWTEVPMDDPVIVDGDYYVVYLQKGTFPNVPGLGIDTDGDFTERSWGKEGKRWSKEKESSSRNYMIRSTVRPILGEKEIKVTNIKVEPHALEMKVNEETLINVTGVMEEGEEEIIVPLEKEELSFTSLNEEVATIDAEGNVKAIRAGETEIEVTYKDLVKQVFVQVEELEEVTPDPGDPEKPDPGKPDPEDPEKPDPGKPDPEDPEKPDPGKPDPEDPKLPDPGKPDPEDPEKPDPGKPDPGKPDPEDPKLPDPDQPNQDEELVFPEKPQNPQDPKQNQDKVEKDPEELEKNESGEELPKTATNMYNIMLIGLILLGVGIILSLRRKQKTI